MIDIAQGASQENTNSEDISDTPQELQQLDFAPMEESLRNATQGANHLWATVNNNDIERTLAGMGGDCGGLFS